MLLLLLGNGGQVIYGLMMVRVGIKFTYDLGRLHFNSLVREMCGRIQYPINLPFEWNLITWS